MSKYWEKRMLELEQANFKDNEMFIEFLFSEYDRALESINKEIYIFLSDFASDNGISLYEAKRLLNQKELKGYKLGLKKFTELAKGDLSDEVERELNNASKAYRISKLQAQELNIKAQVDKLLNEEQKSLFNHLKDQYKTNSYSIIYNLQKLRGFSHIGAISENKLNIILNKPWAVDGENFSERIWKRKDKLINELHKELTQGLIRGDDHRKLTKTITDKFAVTKANAKRLVMTESAFINSKATHDSFVKMGVKKYEIVATLDLKTSEICREMDGKVFECKDEVIGINSPPFHPHCRTVTIPYFDDDIQRELEDEIGRMARNPITGKSERVENLSYKEWYKKYVENNPKAISKEKAWKNRHSDRYQYNKYKSVLGRKRIGKFDDFQELKYNNSEKYEQILREKATISKIDSKSWSESYKNRVKNTYYDFRNLGYEFNMHGVERFIKREEQGKLTTEEVLSVLRKDFNKIQKTDGRKVKFYNNLQIVYSINEIEIHNIIKRGKNFKVGDVLDDYHK